MDIEVDVEFESELNRLWFLAITEGGMQRNHMFPSFVNGISDEECTVCSESETELVVHERNFNSGLIKFIHVDCFEEYVEEIADVGYISVFEVLTVEKHPDSNVTVDELPNDVFEAYLARLNKTIDENVD